MSPWFVSVVISTALLGQPNSDADGASPKLQIRIAIRQLASANFGTRDEAYEFLRLQGMKAEPELRKALRSDSGETRLRARRLLRDLKYGIVPGVNAGIAERIRRFRDGPASDRQQAFKQLLDAKEYEVIERLIRLEPNPTFRHGLLDSLIQHPEAASRFIEFEQVASLIARVGADQPEDWRRAATLRLMFAPNMLQRHVDNNDLDALLKLIREERSAPSRLKMLRAIFVSGSVVESICKAKQLPFLVNALRAEPDQGVRGELLALMPMSPAAAQAVVANKQLDLLMDFAKQEIQANRRHQVFSRLLQSQPVVVALLAKDGLEGVMELAIREEDPTNRGQLLASMLSSPAFRSAMPKDKLAEAAVALAKKEKDPKARHEFLQTLLTNSSVIYALSSGDSLQGIWELIKSDEDVAWQPEAVALLLRSHYAHRLLRKKEEAIWVLQLVRDTKSPGTREKLLSYLLGNYQAHEELLRDGHFDTLLELAIQLPTTSRGRVTGSFLASRAVAQHLISAKRLDVFVEVPRKETHQPTRQACLQGVFRNYLVMPALIKAGHYQTFRGLIEEDPDKVRRASLFGDFLLASGVVQELQKQGDLAVLVEHATNSDAAARRQFLPRLFRNHSAVGLLVAAGHYERLAAIAKENKGEFLDELLGAPKVIEYLTDNKQLEVLFEFVTEVADDNTRRNLLRNMLYNRQVMTKVLDAGHFEPIFNLVCAEKDVNWRSSLLGPALSSPEMLKHFAANQKLATVFDLIRKEPEPRVRSQIISQLAGRGDAITIVVQHEQLDALLRLIKQHTTAGTRGELLGRVLTSSTTLDRLVKKKQQALLLSFAEDTDRASAEAFVTRLFAYRNALDILLDSGHYNALFRLATDSRNAKVSASRISQLFANNKALQQLIARQEIGTLIDLARQVDDADARQTYLYAFCRNEALVRHLINEDLFDDLLQICRIDPDAKVQQKHLATLLLSGKATDELKRLGDLEEILQAALNDTDVKTQRTWLSSLLTRTEAVSALIKHGHFDGVLDVAEKRLLGTTFASVLETLLGNPQAVEYFVRHDRTDLLWQILDSVRRPSQRPYLVSRFTSNDRLMKLIAEKDQLDRLLKAVRSGAASSFRTSVESRIFMSSGTLAGLAGKGKLNVVFEFVAKAGDEQTRRSCLQAFAYRPENRRHLADSGIIDQLLALLKQEDERYRKSYATQLLYDSYLRRKWVGAGKVEALEELISLIPEESHRSRFRQELLLSPSGVLGNVIRRGDFEEAERVVAASKGDAGLAAYVTLQVVREQLPEQIALVQKRYEAESQLADARLLVYLHRAAGDVTTAREVAEKLNDPQLLRPLYAEQQAWSEAAALEAESHRTAPVATGNYFTELEPTLRIEQLGLLAAYYRRAGQQNELDSTIKEIKQFAEAHKDDNDLVWFAAEALLLNGRFDEGIELTATAKIEKAFTLLTFRHEYERALSLVGLAEGQSPDRSWYDKLPCENRAGVASPSDSEQKQRRFDFALRLARIQSHLGKDDEREQLLRVLEEYISGVPSSGESPSRSELQGKLAAVLYQLGELDRAWALAAQTINSTSAFAPAALGTIYGTREIEADAWWVFFRDRFPEESLIACFNRVHLALNPAPDESEGAYVAILQEAMAFAPVWRVASQRDSYWRGIGQTSQRRGHRAEAIECLQHAANTKPEAARAVADLQAELGQWSAAAASYRALWERDHEQLGALYLAGDALVRAGQVEEGQRWKQEANLLAIPSRTRHAMSVDLAARGHTKEAVAQWELLLKTAPLESWELNDAARRLGDYYVATDPKRAAELWEHYLLGDLRPAFWFLKDESYLRMPFTIQKALAAQAIRDGQMDALHDALAIATAAAPGDTRLAEELVPVLEAAGHKPEADRLAARLIEHYRRKSAQYPRSAYFHNNLAWVAARSHRDLDSALKHARQATELAPRNGAYVDTLAEVYFHQGDREAAIRESKRALRLSPFDRSLSLQLERFRAAAIPVP